jgi:AraC-like DNA-binding protein
MRPARPSAPAVALRDTRFENQRLNRLGIELMTLAALRSRVSTAQLCRPERVEFFMLLWVTAGLGAHAIDFQLHALRPGHLVFVRPGQVQQWQDTPGQPLQGLMALVAPASLLPMGRERALALALEDWPSAASFSGPARAELDAAFQALADEFAQDDLSDPGMALIQSLLTSLLLRLWRQFASRALADDRETGQHAEVMRHLQRELNARVRQRPTVAQLVAATGYSASTLNRACAALQGGSVKALIDRRVTLEAQRLLVHSTLGSGQIGLQLGFTEPTNFLKFFRRQAHCTPEAFRAQHARSAAAAGATAAPAVRVSRARGA